MSRRPVWGIVPAKSPVRGKSRLRAAFDEEARALFARGLLEHVLDALSSSDALDALLVATDGDDVAEIARARGARVLRDAGSSTLAGVVDAALAEALRGGAGAAVVFMADLPRLGALEVRRVVAALEDHDVVVVPDRRGVHTNALALAPPTVVPTRFGRPDSFSAHCSDARAGGLRLAVVEDERIAFDVDVPEDLSV